jgi:ribosomal protein L35AE/L33A
MKITEINNKYYHIIKSRILNYNKSNIYAYDTRYTSRALLVDPSNVSLLVGNIIFGQDTNNGKPYLGMIFKCNKIKD